MDKKEREDKEIDKAWAAFDDPNELYLLWKEEGNLLAGQFLGNKYHWGDEEHGIFINPDKAKEIYEEIDEDYETWENEYKEDEFPERVEYIIEGSAEELKAIRILFNTLNSQFGIPVLVDGVYIPLGIFMQTLVGSPYYEGNILTLEEENPNKLILTAKLDKPFALLFALREAFSNLKIISEIEKVKSKTESEKVHLLSLRDGKLLGPFKSSKSFSEGLCPIIPNGSDKYGYIDIDGNIIISPKFGDANSFSDGVALVEVENGRKFYINHKGEKVLEPRFDDFGPFSEGLSCFKKNGKYGYMDKTGKAIIEPIYELFGLFENGIVCVDIKEDKYIDKAGNQVASPKKSDGDDKVEYYIPFKKDGLWGYTDKNENVVICPKFDFEDADVTFEGVSRVKKNGLYGYLKIPSCEWLKEPQFKDGYRSPDSEGFVKITLP